jgi:phage terminase large subunit-like protein
MTTATKSRKQCKPAENWSVLWTCNRSDELARKAGYEFDPIAGGYVVWWIERYCRLYEGDHAGEPLILRGLHSDALDQWPIADEWDAEAKETAKQRAKHYMDGKRVGGTCDWQYEVIMRLFGWRKFSERHNRKIRRFRRGGVWVPKKSKKSPTLAAIGIYLTCGDDEKGNHVYFGAKDGSQAREIAGKHALEMVKASPELFEACSINHNEMQITHDHSRSTLKPMSSGDDRTQKSKEGINGSVLVDETHVVDDHFIARVIRAGISRAEPFHLEFSTAGKDPDCYGKRQRDYGLSVEKGSVTNHSYFFAEWSVPQTLSDEELAADPLKYGRMANPAWGHTVHADEFLDDYNNSKRSISDLSDFKTYRLNIWQRSKNPWLKASDWDACAERFTLEEFDGEPCWLGLDKSKTRDMTALVATFKRDDDFYQWPIFWLPKKTAEDNNHLVRFMDWAGGGHLELIEGEVIYDRPITAFVTQLAKLVRIQSVHYDKTFAADITLEWEESLGITRIEFPQTTMMFAGPVEDYERLVIQHKLKHPNHPVFNWQAGHCEVYSDSKARKTLVKPKHGDIKKIDGMVAGVMSLFGALNTDRPSVYETRGIINLTEGPPEPVTQAVGPDWFNDERFDEDD